MFHQQHNHHLLQRKSLQRTPHYRNQQHCLPQRLLRQLPRQNQKQVTKPENFAGWTITPDGLNINFDPYQMAPYVSEPQEVVIPQSELKSILNPTSHLAMYAE